MEPAKFLGRSLRLYYGAPNVNLMTRYFILNLEIKLILTHSNLIYLALLTLINIIFKIRSNKKSV